MMWRSEDVGSMEPPSLLQTDNSTLLLARNDPVYYFYHHQVHTSHPSPLGAIIFSSIALIGFVANTVLLVYIILHKLYNNFISSYFIAHLCFTNIIALTTVMPIFIHNVWTGVNLFANHNLLCRVQALATCSIWMVLALMSLCIAGVHLLTFARIHYDQLFGLRPGILCGLSWLISFALALPSITNGHVVIYGPSVRSCIWGHSDSGLKFLVYLLCFGVIAPAFFSSYAYIRVLGILYHSPIVFQSLGLYKSRFLVYAFLFSPFYQLPFYIFTTLHLRHDWRIGKDTVWPAIIMFLAYTQSIVSPFFYGASLFMMKEEDMALTARTHKNPTAYQHIQQHTQLPHNPAQAQLI